LRQGVIIGLREGTKPGEIGDDKGRDIW